VIRGVVPYEVIDHTADWGIVVRGASLAEVFEKASSAMFDLMGGLEAVDPNGPIERRVVVDASDRETLLVAWLSELLSEAMGEGVLFASYEVRIDESERTAEGRVRGERLDPSRHRFETELKAVTYHHLRVACDDADGSWSARVVFDV
jgi:SHS2 domain-containing protein